MLSINGLRKSFGNINANNDLNLTFYPSRIHAVIGPNGAGKTTLINQLSGEIIPDHGSIIFKNKNITAFKPWQRAQAGLQRTYQLSKIFPEFTVLENVLIANSCNMANSFGFFENIRKIESRRRDSLKFLELVDLETKKDQLASELSHGEARQLELSMVLSNSPDFILLDEPTAGMSQTETKLLVTILQKLKIDLGILLVEHDMNVVFELADIISVMDKGKIIKTDKPVEVKSDPAVKRAYLGD